ncbi:MAG: hypothetical protein II680_01070, partial [Clostridia bacterium]|nr:hypothetical protein [Clostridia bacterium]
GGGEREGQVRTAHQVLQAVRIIFETAKQTEKGDAFRRVPFLAFFLRLFQHIGQKFLWNSRFFLALSPRN